MKYHSKQVLLKQLVREIVLVEIEVEFAIDYFCLRVAESSEKSEKSLKVVDDSLLNILRPIISFTLMCSAYIVEKRNETDQVNALNI